MPNLMRLNDHLTPRVLAHLGQPAAPPSLRALNRMLRAYVRRVPWETAFRIAKRRNTAQTDDCPRWPAEFWEEALRWGAGGTCFESNYAFAALLTTLGYEVTFTINDMGQQRACHTALIVTLNGTRYVVDVGIPIHVALRIDPHATTRTVAPFHTYIVRPDGERRYQIERTRHPARNIYTLLDTPVSDGDYRTALTRDYGECGLFLDKLVIVKVVDGAIWRFYNVQHPYRFEVFERHGKREVPIDTNGVARTLDERYGIDERVVAAALEALAHRV